MTANELRVLCDLTVALTEIRARYCNNLCVENFAPELLIKLIQDYEKYFNRMPLPARGEKGYDGAPLARRYVESGTG